MNDMVVMSAVVDTTTASTGDHAHAAALEDLGYRGVVFRGTAGYCGLREMLFTGAIVIGLTDSSYRGRYCYASLAEAAAALEAWTGKGDPPGLWIKFKSSEDERCGPGCNGP